MINWKPLPSAKRTAVVIAQTGGHGDLTQVSPKIWDALRNEFDWFGADPDRGAGFATLGVGDADRDWWNRASGMDAENEVQVMAIANLTPGEAKKIKTWLIEHAEELDPDLELELGDFNHKWSDDAWNDWEANPNGENYRQRLTTLGSSHLLERVDDYAAAYREELAAAWEAERRGATSAADRGLSRAAAPSRQPSR